MKLFKSYSEKEVKKIKPLVDQINSKEEELKKLTDEELRRKTDEFKKRLEKGETLDDILPDAFAVVREASRRVLGLRHYDVQLIGGIILHQGRIAEMRTGEGKTLVATLPVYLNALEGQGVHVITVNDYLAKRDSEWMGKLYKFLGLSVGLVVAGMDPDAKQKAYNSDITYGTNNEFGFDYLRDNMVIYKEQLVQRQLHYAIVDEVDSILVDEARTPLIISGRANASSDLYKKADNFVRTLNSKTIIEEDINDLEQEADNENYDYIIDLKAKSASLTQKGIKKAEEYFKLDNFNDLDNATLVHHVNQALRAHGIMKDQTDYIVKDGEVLIVDEFTGRIMYGRRYNNGLHQAIEAKEKVKIADESKTLATITFQNFFRMYDKLSGMTGTAMTEREEFNEIYNLDVVEIPTNKPVVRIDNPDVIYKSEKGKFNAIVDEIEKSYKKGQPVLVGTVSIEKSERLSKLLDKKKIKHQVLNAKYHEKEAEIVAQAGKYGAVTIATNMAGRGTDIMLGGNAEFLAKQEMKKNKMPRELIEESTTYYETDNKDILNAREEFKKLEKKFEEKIKDEKQKVIEAGGLKIIGTERHESRRIDNQLRGRSGRQGDVGESQFYIALEDDLMKIFGGDRMIKLYDRLSVDDTMAIQVKTLSKQVEKAQMKVESRNFSIRKNVLKYDDVMNAQREIIYKQRREVLDGANVHQNILDMIDATCSSLPYVYQEGEQQKINVESLSLEVSNLIGVDLTKKIEKNKDDIEKVSEIIAKEALKIYGEKVKTIPENQLNDVERMVLLRVVDEKWMDHIDNMDELKNGIGLRAYAQKDPVIQYQIEGMDMFEEMVNNIKYDVTKLMLHIRQEDDAKRKQVSQITKVALEAINAIDKGKRISSEEQRELKTVKNDGPKAGRNDLCPCGSGKKYKNCCGK